VSRILHPWRFADSIRQTSKEGEEQLRAELKAIETLLETNGLPMKKDTLAKVQKQLAGISALVDFWWQTVRQDLTQLAMTPRWTQWAEDVLLPLMYWQEQLRRTRRPGQKAQIALVLWAVEEACERHPCTRQLKPEVLAGWKAWAAEHARAFQRASSADAAVTPCQLPRQAPAHVRERPPVGRHLEPARRRTDGLRGEARVLQENLHLLGVQGILGAVDEGVGVAVAERVHAV
jgi:hypothetical protein